ncbi:MAG: response regulator transcription factor [Bacteroidota bacterium]
MNKLNILIVEDHHIFRLGIRTLLERQKTLQLVGEASDGAQAIRLAEDTNPEVILLDVHLPKLSGAEVCRGLLEVSPQSKILVLSAEKNERHINEMIQAGALGYMLKDASSIELTNAIKVIAKGNSYFSKEVSSTLLSRLRHSRMAPMSATAPALQPVKLSKRESEILKLISEELTNKEIASTLFISQRTVDTHRRNLLQKLKVKNTAGLVKFYLRWVDRIAG